MQDLTIAWGMQNLTPNKKTHVHMQCYCAKISQFYTGKWNFQEKEYINFKI